MRTKTAPVSIAALALLAGCSTATVRHGNENFAAVEDETRKRILTSLKQLSGPERDAVKHDAPATKVEPWRDGQSIVNMEWRASRQTTVVARFIGNAADPRTGKFDIYALQNVPGR